MLVESKEALAGVFELAIAIAEQLKDGAQVADLGELFVKFQSDPVFHASLVKAVSGIQKVPAEMKTLDLASGLDLAVFVIPYIPRMLEAMSKEAVG